VTKDELWKAYQSKRVAVLPCKIGAKVYTVERILFPCERGIGLCKHGDSLCWSEGDPIPAFVCPDLYEIKTNICQGFTVGEDEDGNISVSRPGEWGYEGLETFGMYDADLFYTKKEAVAKLQLLQTRNYNLGCEGWQAKEAQG